MKDPQVRSPASVCPPIPQPLPLRNHRERLTIAAEYAGTSRHPNTTCPRPNRRRHHASSVVRLIAEASRKVTEVSCERFFGTSGYVSQSRRSRLGVGVRNNYETISMLSNIVQNVHIDPEWVASEYLKRCKKGARKKENTMDD
eukprot:scaffold21506_cov23-Cyclotella_meneghiniana.AAC.1